MLREVIEHLAIRDSGVYLDATLGGGGHSSRILERLGPEGRLIASDADRDALDYVRERLGSDPRLDLWHGYFAEVCNRLDQDQIELDGALLDLGVSSRQLDTEQIGLSYRQEMPLDMRFDASGRAESARTIVNRYSTQQIADILRALGEEPAAWTIAKSIERRRRQGEIATTFDLRDAVESVIPERFLFKTLSRVFQALRLAVNDELGELETALERISGRLRAGGRFVVLTYHSLEDRKVKQAFRREENPCTCPPELPICQCGAEPRLKVLTRRPLTPSPAEIEENKRARSAKLRAAERISSNPGNVDPS